MACSFEADLLILSKICGLCGWVFKFAGCVLLRLHRVFDDVHYV